MTVIDEPSSDTASPASKGARTRQAILAAAIARFGRDGYRATSVADIARDANATAVDAVIRSAVEPTLD